MRYDDWDVILFPKDSHVPIQEFKTACYVSPEECKHSGLLHPVIHLSNSTIRTTANATAFPDGRPLPTLTCYISSLPPSTPFRISVHSWTTAAKASALIESRRKANQKVVYTVQVIVDGARVL
jgi:hypothetical protein